MDITYHIRLTMHSKIFTEEDKFDFILEELNNIIRDNTNLLNRFNPYLHLKNIKNILRLKEPISDKNIILNYCVPTRFLKIMLIDIKRLSYYDNLIDLSKLSKEVIGLYNSLKLREDIESIEIKDFNLNRVKRKDSKIDLMDKTLITGASLITIFMLILLIQYFNIVGLP